jgi:hypothetical protein
MEWLGWAAIAAIFTLVVLISSKGDEYSSTLEARRFLARNGYFPLE